MKRRTVCYLILLVGLLILSACSSRVYAGKITPQRSMQVLATPNVTLPATANVTPIPIASKASIDPSQDTSEVQIYNTSPTILLKSNGDEVLKSKYFGFRLTFPASWSGKYTVVEAQEWLAIYFKPDHPRILLGKEDIPCLFLIEKVTNDFDDSFFDAIGYFDIKGVTYFAGGPTDLYDGPEYELYINMEKDIDEILASVK